MQPGESRSARRGHDVCDCCAHELVLFRPVGSARLCQACFMPSRLSCRSIMRQSFMALLCMVLCLCGCQQVLRQETHEKSKTASMLKIALPILSTLTLTLELTLCVDVGMLLTSFGRQRCALTLEICSLYLSAVRLSLIPAVSFRSSKPQTSVLLHWLLTSGLPQDSC